MYLEIETERLILGTFDGTDVARRVELANDFEVARMTANMPFPYTHADAQEWIERHEAGRAAGTDYPFAIIIKNEGIAGSIGLHKEKENDPFFELGYWLGRPYWGKGYATEAVRGILEWAQQELSVRTLTACYFDDNPASANVLKKVGFVPTGNVCEDFSRARGLATRGVNLVWHA